MGIVFLAHDLRHSRDVAIKVLRPEFAMAVSADRFLREIQIEAQLKHPHILPLFDSGDAGGLLYYVMPYVVGQSLQARLLRDSQLPLSDAIRITGEIAGALSHAHSLGFVHRDVKPGNILLGEGHALLADFGIARAITGLAGDRLSDSGMVVGTPEYMSPEQGAARGRVDSRSDVYSLGCVLYEMLSGEPPFTGPTAQAVIARHMHERARSLRVVRSTVPEHVEEAIQVALAKVPADRFTTMDEFIAALGPEGESATASRRARVTRRSYMSRARLIGGAALLGSLGLWKSSVPAGGSLEANRLRSAPSLSSIAVLYLEDRSEQGKLDYLSAGLTEDLIDQLAAVKALRVISPDGVRPYRGRDIPLDSLARIFDVGTIVTGTLSRSGDRLRASVRLSDAANAVQLFSGTFEKPLGNVLDLRDTLADEVARQLRIRLGEAIHLEERRAGTSSSAAWHLVRQAEQVRTEAQDLSLREVATSDALYRHADSLLAKAEELDRSWAEPAVLRGWLAYDQADRAAAIPVKAGEGSSSAVLGWINTGVQHANRALKTAPDLPEGLELRGSLLYRGWALTSMAGTRDTTNQLETAERDLRSAASLPRSHQARALSTLSAVLQFSGKLAEANLAAKRAYEADAYLRDASGIVLRLFNTSLNLKRYAEAADWCERGRLAFPREWFFLMCQLSLMAWSPPVRPDAEKAWGVMAGLDSVAPADALPWLRPQMTMIVATVLARAGLPDSAERVIVQARAAGAADPELAYYEALAWLRLGQSKKAAVLIRQLLQQGPNFEAFLRSQSLLTPVWTDPVLQDPG
jgi:serine/threonine-protein kinase